MKSLCRNKSVVGGYMKLSDGAKRGIIIALLVCAILFVLMFSMGNMTMLGEALSKVLSVSTPILIGFAIAYVLNPILRFYEFKVFKKVKKKNRIRGLSILCTYLTAFAIIAAVLYLLIPSIIDSIFVQIIPNYDTYVGTATDFINKIINKIMSNESAAEYIDETTIKAFIARFFDLSGDMFAAIADYVVHYAMGLFVGIKNTVIGVFISIYVLISKEKLQAQVRKFGAAMFSESRTRHIGKYINLTHRTFSNFFVGQLLDACILTVVTFLVLTVFNIQPALLVSVIVGVTNIIPIFGPIIGAIPSFFLIFIINPQKALWFIIIIIILQQIDGNIIAPKILGESTGISSLGVIIAIIVMGDLFGIFGMLIGVPVFAVGITVTKEFVETRLRKKGKPTDTAEYYLKDSVADPYEHHVPITKKIWNNIECFIGKLIAKIKKEKMDIGKGEAKSAKEDSERPDDTKEKAETKEKGEN